MTDVQHDYLSMFQTVSRFFLEKESQITTIIPAFAGLRPLFDTRVEAILLLSANSEQTTAGYTQDKQQRRQRLEDLLIRVGSAAVLHYTHTVPDAEMATRLHLSLRQYKKQKAADLLTNSRFVWETADGFKILLAPFSVSAALVDEMAAAISAFEEMRTTPRDMRAAAKRQRAQMDVEIKELNSYLKNTMDVLLRNLEFSNMVLYSTYKSVRKVHKNRGRRSDKSPDKIFIHPGSIKELVLRKPVTSVDDVLHLSSHSKAAQGTVIFYYSATPAGEQQLEGITLAAGTRQSTTAGALGFSEEKKHLCVRNTAMQRHVAGAARGR